MGHIACHDFLWSSSFIIIWYLDFCDNCVSVYVSDIVSARKMSWMSWRFVIFLGNYLSLRILFFYLQVQTNNV